MNENLQKYALLAEIISSVAVLVTLVFLIYEIRTNTQAVQFQAAEMSANSLLLPMINPEKLPDIYAKIKEVDGQTEQSVIAMIDQYGMTTSEAVQWTRFTRLNWAFLENEFLANGPSETLEANIRGFLNSPDLKIIFDSTPARFFAPGFKEYAESVSN